LQIFAEFLHDLDPLLPFKIGPMNGREARESGLRLAVTFLGLGLMSLIAPRTGKK
jgi:hypothetical protein